MNPNSAKNWTLNSYTNDTWTDLVAEPGIVATLSMANTTGASIDVEVRLSDGSGNNLARIIPTNELVANDAFQLDIKSIPVTGTQTIQVKASAVGIEFLAGGAVESA